MRWHGHVAPRRASAQNPQNAGGRSPLVRDGWATFAPIRQQWIENAPFRARQIAPTQCCLLQKGSLESKLDSSVKNRQHALAVLKRASSATPGFSDPIFDIIPGGHCTSLQ
jgi:hypothetical protein